MSSTSRKPSVVTSAVSAPLRSMIALVARVVPWMSSPTAAGSAPDRAITSSTPASTATSGASGVVSTLAVVRLVAVLQHDIGEGAADVHADAAGQLWSVHILLFQCHSSSGPEWSQPEFDSDGPRPSAEHDSIRCAAPALPNSLPHHMRLSVSSSNTLSTEIRSMSSRVVWARRIRSQGSPCSHARRAACTR